MKCFAVSMKNGNPVMQSGFKLLSGSDNDYYLYVGNIMIPVITKPIGPLVQNARVGHVKDNLITHPIIEDLDDRKGESYKPSIFLVHCAGTEEYKFQVTKDRILVREHNQMLCYLEKEEHIDLFFQTSEYSSELRGRVYNHQGEVIRYRNANAVKHKIVREAIANNAVEWL